MLHYCMSISIVLKCKRHKVNHANVTVCVFHSRLFAVNLKSEKERERVYLANTMQYLYTHFVLHSIEFVNNIPSK